MMIKFVSRVINFLIFVVNFPLIPYERVYATHTSKYKAYIGGAGVIFLPIYGIRALGPDHSMYFGSAGKGLMGQDYGLGPWGGPMGQVNGLGPWARAILENHMWENHI